MKKASDSQRGYSLPEMLVVVAIFATFIIAALLIYDRQNRTFKQGVDASDMQQATRAAFNKLTGDIRMTGFDFDRDGVPQDGEQQPDEQLEYAGRAAITIRGNFNYFTAAANDHGREVAFEPAGGKFPIVTTSNKEIVTYALKSANSAANTSSITFYADVAKPRATYSGGDAESLVTISGIDTTNNNPPYTLYKFTIQDDGQPDAGTPIAENIRRMEFSYFTDLQGTTVPVKAGAPVVNGAIGGSGQYDPSNVGGTTNFIDREIRSSIRSVNFNLVGMSSGADPGYTNPTETLTPFKGYRTYQLQSLLTPRNLGLSGTAEPSLGPPGPAHVTSVCDGHCGAVVVTWNPPTTGSPVEKYKICYDTDATGPFANCQDAQLNTTSVFPGLPSGPTAYLFKVKSINDEGQTFSDNYISAQILNMTQPQPPDPLNATIDLTELSVTWDRPSNNESSKNTLTCIGSGGSTDATLIPDYETLHYRIWRGVDDHFNTASATESTLVVDDANYSSIVTAAVNNTWVDTDANKLNLSTYPAAACKDYYYRIQAFDTCAGAAASNSPANVNTAISTINPPGGSTAVHGRWTSTATPGTSLLLSVDPASSCNALANTCSIVLKWPPMLQSTTLTSLPVDAYTITRQSALGAAAKISAPLAASAPQVTDALQFAKNNGARVMFTDNTALEHDPTTGEKYHWYYTVSGVSCSITGNQSNEVSYPSCSFSGSTYANTGSLGPGTGATPGDPFIMAGGDSVIITPATGHVVARVEFVLTDMGGNIVDSPAPDTTSPYQYMWVDKTDAQTYALSVRVVEAVTGCINTVGPIYIQDQAPSGCTLSAGTLGVANSTTSGSTKTQDMTVVFKDASTFENATPSGLTAEWIGPANRTINLASIIWNGAATNAVGTSNNGSSTAITTVTTSTAPNIPQGGITQYGITFRFTYSKQDADLTVNPVSKLCISYSVASEPGITKTCNVLPGASAGQAPNPTTCQ